MSKENKNPNVPNLRFNYNGEWKKYELNEIIDFFKGNGFSKSDISSEGKPIILYGELYTTYKDEIINTIISKTNNTSDSDFLSKFNDIIIPSSGEDPIDIAVARALLKDNIILGGDLNVLRPKVNLSSAFLSYELNGKRKLDIAKKAQGKSIVHLHNSDLKTIKVFLPNFEEQTKIANLLQAIDKKINTQIKIIEDYIKLIKLINNCSASDNINANDKLSNLFEIYTNNKIPESNDGQFLLVDMGTIDTNGNYINSKYTNYDASLLKKGELVMPKDDIGGGNIICKTFYVDEDKKYALSDHVFSLKPVSEKINSYYFSCLINSNTINRRLKRLVTGSAQLGINMENISKFVIDYCDVKSTQNFYCNIINKLNEKRIIEQKILNNLHLIKQYLLNNLFI